MDTTTQRSPSSTQTLSFVRTTCTQEQKNISIPLQKLVFIAIDFFCSIHEESQNTITDQSKTLYDLRSLPNKCQTSETISALRANVVAFFKINELLLSLSAITLWKKDYSGNGTLHYQRMVHHSFIDKFIDANFTANEMRLFKILSAFHMAENLYLDKLCPPPANEFRFVNKVFTLDPQPALAVTLVNEKMLPTLFKSGYIQPLVDFLERLLESLPNKTDEYYYTIEIVNEIETKKELDRTQVFDDFVSELDKNGYKQEADALRKKQKDMEEIWMKTTG